MVPPTRLLSTRACAQLWRLQAALRDAVEVRNQSLRVFRGSRRAVTVQAQHSLWLEFSWADQEYRQTVIELVAFCERHDRVARQLTDRR